MGKMDGVKGAEKGEKVIKCLVDRIIELRKYQIGTTNTANSSVLFSRILEA